MNNKNLGRWLLVVLIIAIFLRIGVWLTYPFAESNDTPTYRHLSNSLRNHGFERYNGTRTPGYPFFLMLTSADSVTYAVQLGLGVCATLLVFYIAWKLTRRAWFAGLMGLAHTLNMGQLFFEASLLTESLATFLLFLVLAGLVKIWDTGKQPNETDKSLLAVYLLIGLAAAALAMVRPLFAPIALWGAFFLAFFWRAAPWKTRWGAAILTALPLVIALVVWVNFIHARFKIWGLDSMGGYHNVNHVTSFFERAPNEYASIRDTFLEFRERQLAETGSTVNTIWAAIPTLMEQEKRNYYALGRIMGNISQRLIAENPDLYARNVLLGWWRFWRVGIFWQPDNLLLPGIQSGLRALMYVQRVALFGINLLFLVGSVALLWKNVRTRLNPPLFIWFSASAVWVISILQALAEHGDNARFLAPMQTLVVLVALWGIWRIKGLVFEKNAPPGTVPKVGS